MILFFLHNAINLNKVSGHLNSKTVPNHHSTTTPMLNSWHNAIFTLSFRSSSDNPFLFTSKNLKFGLIITFFLSFKSNPSAIVPIVIFTTIFYKRFLNWHTHPLNPTERILLFTNIGYWCVEWNSKVISGLFFFCFFWQPSLYPSL